MRLSNVDWYDTDNAVSKIALPSYDKHFGKNLNAC